MPRTYRTGFSKFIGVIPPLPITNVLIVSEMPPSIHTPILTIYTNLFLLILIKPYLILSASPDRLLFLTNYKYAMRKSLFILFLYLLPLAFAASSCVSTRVEANPYQDSVENLECQKKSSWSYWWGVAPGSTKMVSANPEIAGTECPCTEKSMSWVVVKTSFTDVLLSMVTLGIVNHRTVSYGCARPQGGEGDLDN